MSFDKAIALIPEIYKKLEILDDILDELEYLTPDLSKCKGVAQYLKKTEKTIYNYIDSEKFILNYHYYRKDGKIFFVEEKIKEFRKIYRSKSHFTLINKKLEKVN